MGIVKFAVGGLLGMALLCTSVAAGGFENTAVGTTAAGMGGAFRSIADDWTAAYYNPAGLAFQKDNQLGGYASFTQLRNELSPNYRNGANQTEFGVINNRNIYNFHQIFYTPGSGLVTRLPFLNNEMVFGFSAYQPFDYNINWQLYQPLTVYNDSAYGRYPTGQFKNDLDVVAFQFSAAKSFNDDKLAVGIGLQRLRADLFYNDVVFRPNPMTGELAADQWSIVPEFVSVNGNGWGWGLRGGMMYKFNKGTIGLTAAIPFDITIKGSADLNYLMPKNFALANKYLIGTPEYLFIAGSDLHITADFETKLKLPMSVAAAFSYQATEKLTLAVDAELMMWSRFDGYTFSYSNFSNLPKLSVGDSAQRAAAGATFAYLTANTERPTNWQSAAKVALGARYDLMSSLTLIAGGSFDQSADRNHETSTPQLVDIGNKLGLSFGGIVHAGQRFDLSLVLNWRHYPDLSTTAQNDLNGDGIVDSFPGDYKAQTIETQLSFGYRF
ncbi:MAG: outer membrane protein transport protein [candidate division Zixibacteria bacterium]|nr:outer membrane protein transport protein [candidate division Zixibacteria bacterium]